MRSSRVTALVTGVALLAACGGDSTGPSTNTAPVADFTFRCDNLTCTFTDRSTDADGTIASQAWDFGDTQTGGGNTASHTYAGPGTYQVTVKVTDNGGMSTTSPAKPATVTAVSATVHASFTVTCASLDCTVTNNSTATGAVTTWAWTFGDGQTSTLQSPPTVHYNVTSPTTYPITLVVTSDGVTSQATELVNVSPPAGLTCSNGQACTLLLPQKSTVIVTLKSHDCAVHGNKFVLTAPVTEVLFEDGCYAPVEPDPAASHPLNGGAAFNGGTELEAQVTSGFPGTTNAQLEVTGDYQNGWTLNYDDGYVGPGEPDFNDLVIFIKATPAP
jgi:PKD repeat protein